MVSRTCTRPTRSTSFAVLVEKGRKPIRGVQSQKIIWTMYPNRGGGGGRLALPTETLRGRVFHENYPPHQINPGQEFILKGTFQLKLLHCVLPNAKPKGRSMTQGFKKQKRIVCVMLHPLRPFTSQNTMHQSISQSIVLDDGATLCMACYCNSRLRDYPHLPQKASTFNNKSLVSPASLISEITLHLIAVCRPSTLLPSDLKCQYCLPYPLPGTAEQRTSYTDLQVKLIDFGCPPPSQA